MRPLLIVAVLLALATLPVATALDPAVTPVESTSVSASADTASPPLVVPTVTAPPAPVLPAAPQLPITIPVAPLPTAPTPHGVPLEGVPILAAKPAREANSESRSEAMAHAIIPAAKRAAPAAVATVGILALLQAVGAFRIVAVGGVALYSRLTKSNLLDNEHRDSVYKLIQETPGLGVSEIAQKTGLGWGTTVYHLDRLEREGFVASERGGLHRCYFGVGTIDRATRKATAAIKGDTSANVAQVLRERPGITQTELCEALGMSASAASKQISKLETAGLVRRERDWKTVRLFPQAALGAAVA